MRKTNPRKIHKLFVHSRSVRWLLIIVILLIIGLIMDSVFAETIGKPLYQTHCAACHGEKGSGGVGVPIMLKSFQNSVSDQYLFKTIRNGRPGRVMPAFDQLSDSQIKAIVRHMRKLTDSPSRNADKQQIKGNLKAGFALYARHCASCHGDNGQGGKGTGVTFSRPRNLPIIAPALNNPGFLKSATDQMIRQTTLNGRKGTPMPAFAKQGLSQQDANNLVAYIRSFEKQHNKTSDKIDKQAAFLKIKSNYSFTETVANIKRAVQGANYRLIKIQPINKGLVNAGQENKKQLVIYFCNFRQLNAALAIDPRIGMFLPCRLTVIQHKNAVYVYSINPARLSLLFNNNELNKACDNMKQTYLSIIEEANL